MTDKLTIKKLFIANRGEIARRIATTCRQLGIQTTCISSKHVPAYLKECVDEFYFVEEESLSLYLDGPRLIEMAQESNCDSIHPGFGFLSESADFAKLVIDSGLVWIGPSASAIRSMASKASARSIADEVGVPCIPGIQGAQTERSSIEQLIQAEGYPVLIKAALGGGGKGMRAVHTAQDLQEALTRAASEAESAFGDSSLIVEKLLINPRHVEVQILGDHHDQILILGDRDCSIQRRHQKIVEEAPAPGLHPETRQALHDAAKKLAQKVGYSSAGTVEFLVEHTCPDSPQRFYFLEMNTRLQVEHPVTEEVFQTDLVAAQIRIAQGEPVSTIVPRPIVQGHSIEVRIYAEDPETNFMPSPGDIHGFTPHYGPSIRWELGLDPIDRVSGLFDPMIAKLVCTGSNRIDAISKLQNALDKTLITGIPNNICFLSAIAHEQSFRQGPVGTAYIEQNLTKLLNKASQRHDDSEIIKETCSSIIQESTELNTLMQSQRVYQKNTCRVKKTEHMVFETSTFPKKVLRSGLATVRRDSGSQEINYCHTRLPEGQLVAYKALGQQYSYFFPAPGSASKAKQAQQDGIYAPVPGRLVSLKVEEGQQIKQGQTVIILESMKMEFEVKSDHEGRVKQLHVSQGQQVDADEPLLSFE